MFLMLYITNTSVQANAGGTTIKLPELQVGSYEEDSRENSIESISSAGFTQNSAIGYLPVVGERCLLRSFAFFVMSFVHYSFYNPR